ncbi:MAG: hypothetical protein JXA22_07060 [Candidatus Thermoplasmatota archaeon]|nr:hypothetical protein [Candidatus Thermoplasmatota archaeon]
MRTWLKVVLISFGVFFLILSAIWFLALSTSGFPAFLIIQFIFLFLLGIAPLVIVIVVSKGEKPPDVRIEQKIEIKGEDLVGGDRSLEKLKCHNCGAGLETKDVKFTDMGMIVKCPYCDQVYTMEEKPKW